MSRRTDEQEGDHDMGKPMLIAADRASGGMRVEYVKCRQALRFTGSGMTDGDSVEIPFAQLLEELDADPSVFGIPMRYLLFGGVQPYRSGGAGDITGVFDSEAPARRAFMEMRHDRSAGERWAELVALDGRGRVTRLGWFGMEARRRDPLASWGRRKGRLRPWLTRRRER